MNNHLANGLRFVTSCICNAFAEIMTPELLARGATIPTRRGAAATIRLKREKKTLPYPRVWYVIYVLYKRYKRAWLHILSSQLHVLAHCCFRQTLVLPLPKAMRNYNL